MERRGADRVAFAAPITIGDSTRIRCGGYGKLVNIGNHGAFIKVAGEYAVSDQLTISIHLVSASAVLSVTLPGTVARTTSEGIGFHSPHLDMSLLLDFEDLLQDSHGSPRRLKEDFFEYAVDGLYPFTVGDCFAHIPAAA